MKIEQLLERRRNTRIEEKNNSFYVWSLFTKSYLTHTFKTHDQAETAADEHERKQMSK